MTKSAITFDSNIFNPDRTPPGAKQVNAYLVSQSLAAPQGSELWEIGAAEFRRLQDEGKTSWPAPTLRLPQATYVDLPSRDSERSIKCRVMPPLGKSEGVFLWIHGGGHVLGHCDWFDETLNALATTTNLTVISPEYRLAPENPFPAGPEDVYDVAAYLVDHSPSTYSGALKFIGGESAGSTLSMLIVLHLLQERPNFAFQGAAFMYGLFDWSILPSAGNWTTPLVMRSTNIEHFREAYLGSRSPSELKNPAISPLYHEIFQYPGSHIKKGMVDGEKDRAQLPPALFMCGTLDPVIDDNILMSFRYQIAGGEAVIKFVEGGAHSLLMFPEERYEPATKGKSILREFLKERL